MATKRAEARAERETAILDGALRAFAANGYAQTSMKDIAVEAGIASPGLIYHYYSNKADLLRAVLTHISPSLQLVDKLATLESLPIEEALLLFACSYLKTMCSPELTAGMRVMMREAMSSVEFAQILGEAGPFRMLGGLSSFLNSKMDAGILKHGDPQVAARCFMGPLFAHVFINGVVRMPDHLTMEPAQYARACVTQYLHGSLIHPKGALD